MSRRAFRRREAMVDEAEDIQADAYECAKRVEKLMKRMKLDEENELYLTEILLGPLQSAAMGCDDLIRSIRETQ